MENLALAVGILLITSSALLLPDLVELYFKNKKQNELPKNYIKNILKDRYQVFEAENGVDALTKLETIPVPQLIVSDIMMNQMDGYSLYDALSKKAGFSDIPFIFLTGSSQLEIAAGLFLGSLCFVRFISSVVFLPNAK